MDVIRQHGCDSTWGSVSVENLERGGLLSTQDSEAAIPVGGDRYTWHPPQDIEDQLYHDFTLSLDCLTRRDGVRCFTPLDVPAFTLHSSLGGSALLARQANLSGEERFGYHFMRLVYQQSPQLREHHDRAFNYKQVLYIPRGGRIGLDDAHVLPVDLGLDSEGQGHPWNPCDLINHGRDAAIEAGNSSPDEATCIHMGLVAAARRNPIKLTNLSPAESTQLVRLSLFDLGPSPGPIDESLIEKVQQRLLPVLERHIEDDTASFNNWFFENVDNLVHFISKKKRGGGPLPRSAVREAFLELVFRSFTYVGDSVHLQMVAFTNALPETLSVEECALFASIYLKEPYLGGLPLLLLHARFPFLREAIIDLWSQPLNRERLGVVLRMLHYYGQMTSKKREGDRHYKKQALHRNDRGQSALILALEPDQTGKDPEVDLFQMIAEELREKRNCSCPCGTTQHWRAQLAAEERTDREIVLDDICGVCGKTERIAVDRKQFEQIGRAVKLK